MKRHLYLLLALMFVPAYLAAETIQTQFYIDPQLLQPIEQLPYSQQPPPSSQQPPYNQQQLPNGQQQQPTYNQPPPYVQQQQPPYNQQQLPYGQQQQPYSQQPPPYGQQQQPSGQLQPPYSQQQPPSGQQPAMQFTPAVSTKLPAVSKPMLPPLKTAPSAFPDTGQVYFEAVQPGAAPAVQPQPMPEPFRMSPTERALNEAPLLIEAVRPQFVETDNIEQFGYSFFKQSAAPITSQVDVPVAADYLLGTGDRIILTVWGSIDGSYELEVNRSGEIILPKVGPVKVAGVTYGQVTQVIRTNMARVYKDFNLNVNLGRIRLIKVYIIGEVAAPGDYNLNSLTTVLAALTAAGGPTRNGTLRNIQIKRGGTLVESVDLYDFFLKGDKSRDIRLQSGDTIFVPTLGAVAGIAGNVRRPAIYELKNEKNLQELLQLADGINPGSFLQRVQVSRIKAHDKKIVTDVSLDPGASGKSLDELTAAIPVSDMDMVRISKINSLLRDYVRLQGYVLRQGDYALKPGMRISDLLTRDNLLPEFYADAGQLIRLYPPDLHPETVLFSPAKALAGDAGHNHLLQEFDRVKIFSRREMEEIPRVRIHGEVQRPGEYRLYSNMTVRDLLLNAGQPKRTAYLKNTEITRISKDGEAVNSFSINVNLEEALKGNPKDNIVLHPYDELVVRKIPNWAEQTEKYITLKGEFVFPGIYPVYKGERLDSIIRRAGGFTDKAFLAGAKFTREQIREMQQKRMDEVLAREEVSLVRKQGELAAISASKEEVESTKAAMEGLMKAIAMLKTAKAEGRMIIQLSSLDKLKDSEYNFEVMGGDTLEIPIDPRVVTVFGQVYNPNSYQYIAGETVSDYLAKSGGFTRDAESSDSYVIKAAGTVLSRQMTSSFLGFGGFMSKELQPGDTLVVPQKLERIAWIREIKDIATILGQLALVAGVLVSM